MDLRSWALSRGYQPLDTKYSLEMRNYLETPFLRLIISDYKRGKEMRKKAICYVPENVSFNRHCVISKVRRYHAVHVLEGVGSPL